MTIQFESIETVLDFAIQEEENAVRLYRDLAGKIDIPSVKQALTAFAEEERCHKERLEAVKRGEVKLMGMVPTNAARDLADILVNVDTTADMDYADVLVLAMRKEKAAFRMYTALAEQAESPEIAQVFRDLAAEEANHKVRFEIEYDDWIRKEGQKTED
jgi:rubrerythrin